MENYFRLGEGYDDGICEMQWCTVQLPHPPMALRPTVSLLSHARFLFGSSDVSCSITELMFETQSIDDLEGWYEEKLKTAAHTKFRRIEGHILPIAITVIRAAVHFMWYRIQGWSSLQQLLLEHISCIHVMPCTFEQFWG